MIISATNASVDIVTSGRMMLGNQLFTNIHTLFTTTNIVTGIKNSMIITVIATVLTVLVAAMAGYGFEIYKSRIKDKVMALLMSMMVLYGNASNTPLPYVCKWGLLNTFLSVILPSMATAFLDLFFRQNTKSFLEGNPSGCQGRRTGRNEVLFPHLPPGHAFDLCGGHHYHPLYEHLEQLLMAAGCPSDRRQDDPCP